MTASIQTKNIFIIIITFILGYLITFLPFPDVFSKDAIYMLSIAFISAVFWVTECIPIALTGFVIILLQSLLGVQTVAQGLSYIATPINSILFTGFIISSALSKYDLDRWIGLNIVSIMGNKPKNLILGFMVGTAFLSMWISNTAATAINIPIAIGILNMANAEPKKSNFGKAAIIGVAFAANIGGMATPVGTPACSITIGFIDKMLGVEISFLDWMIMATPIAAILIPLAWFLLLKLYPPEIAEIQGGSASVVKELNEMGRLNFKQKHVMALFFFSVGLWISDTFLPLMPGWLYIASILISLIFMTPVIGVIEWKDAAKEVNWDIFILVGGGLALGTGLQKTGVISIIADSLAIHLEGVHIYLIVIVLSLITSLSISFFSSLTATSSTFVPVAIGLAIQLSAEPITLAVVAGLSSCLAFLLPANTPPNAVAYSCGYFKTFEMAKAGILLMISSSLVLAIVFNILWV